MIVVRRILCPIDQSEFSRRALSHALAVARWYEADVTALHVRPRVPRPLEWGEEAPAPVLEGLLEGPELDASVGRIVAQTASEEPVTVAFRDGGVVQQILAAARELPADLIVMGTHGASGFERLMMGSVTENVLRRARCPVLTVPPAAPSAPARAAVRFRTIVCGVDFSATSLHALDYALSMAQEAQAGLLLVHVFESVSPEHDVILATRLDLVEFRQELDAAALERMARLIPDSARSWCDPELIVRHGKPHRELVHLARERAADLVVLGAHGPAPLDTALFGSTTSHVVRQAGCPVLTVTCDPRAAAAVA